MGLISLFMQQVCIQCSSPFEISDEDLKFYDSVSPSFDGKKYAIPTPKMCPYCRFQQRYAWRNERTLYLRKCDGSGKPTFSVFSEDKPFKQYQPEYWYSDAWDGKTYGRDFDFSRPFFEQFQELMRDVPQLALSVVNNQNCDYINQAGWNKNCYLIFEAGSNEGCMYSNYIQHSRDCIDCLKVFGSELCYECMSCENSYNLRYSEDSVNCSDSWFLKSCIGCKNCFSSVNLRNKEFYFYNQKLNKEEYAQRLAQVDFSRAGVEQLRTHFRAYVLGFPEKYMHGIQNINSTGDYLSNTQNCQNCYELMSSQDCRYVINARNMKNVYDVLVFGEDAGAEFCYESHEIGDGARNVCFSDQSWGGIYEIYYSKLCLANSHHLLGCVGLKKSSYCILNKQYTKEEWESLAARVVEHMQKTDEWGKFFPTSLSPFAYNETMAQDYYPLDKQTALANGFKWKDPEEKLSQPQKVPIPESILQTPEEITKEVLVCTECGKNYKVIAQELQFYRKMGLPVPVKCHNCRHKVRAKLRNPRYLWNRSCGQCGKPFQSTYAPEKPEKVLCEECYLKVVY